MANKELRAIYRARDELFMHTQTLDYYSSVMNDIGLDGLSRILGELANDITHISNSLTESANDIATELLAYQRRYSDDREA